MTNASNGKLTTTMTTLDKLWTKPVTEEKDIDMEDTQEKTQGQTNKNEGKTNKNEKKRYDTPLDVQPLFLMLLRFKISSTSKEEANKKHQDHFLLKFKLSCFYSTFNKQLDGKKPIRYHY